MQYTVDAQVLSATLSHSTHRQTAHHSCHLQERRRASIGAKSNTNQILVVPASAQHQRSAKYIYAKICGIPIVTEHWVYACANYQRLLPLDCHKQCKDVLRGPSDPHEVFRGCKVFLAGPEQSIGEFADLMQHAGECRPKQSTRCPVFTRALSRIIMDHIYINHRHNTSSAHVVHVVYQHSYSVQLNATVLQHQKGLVMMA